MQVLNMGMNEVKKCIESIMTEMSLERYIPDHLIGIQLGGIGSIAPERKKDLAKLVTKAMFGGALASWLTATIAGILI